jgi:hypothetical protein
MELHTRKCHICTALKRVLGIPKSGSFLRPNKGVDNDVELSIGTNEEEGISIDKLISLTEDLSSHCNFFSGQHIMWIYEMQEVL